MMLVISVVEQDANIEVLHLEHRQLHSEHA